MALADWGTSEAGALCAGLGGPWRLGLFGMKLLREWLSPEQLAQYDAHGYFDVIGCDSGNRYRIHQGTAMNVIEIDRDSGYPRVGLCFTTETGFVTGDVMLAQKIALETKEFSVLVVAHRFAINP